MFTCFMGHCSKAGEKMHRTVVETRNMVYLNSKDEVVGKGTEIVREIALCSDHAIKPAAEGVK